IRRRPVRADAARRSRPEVVDLHHDQLRTASTLTSDPFALLGVPVTLDLDAARLETIYLRKSRDTHPDHREGDSRDDTDETETLLHAAALNQAFRDLSDPWRRAEALVEHHAPDAMERAKRLAPEFLAEALELAE